MYEPTPKGRSIADQTLILLEQLNRLRPEPIKAEVLSEQLSLLEDGQWAEAGPARDTPQMARIRDRILRMNSPLAANAARIYAPSVPPSVATQEDLYSIAMLGINKAIDTYEPHKGAFSTHCKTCMKRLMSHYRRDHMGIPRSWVEIRDAMRTRVRAMRRISGAPVSEERVALKSMGVSLEHWQAIRIGFQEAWSRISYEENPEARKQW
jgi:DNA-directed RNA polymerase specialized sigma subunit